MSMDFYNELYRERQENPYKPENDNDKAPVHLRELFGKLVTVSSARDSSRWRGCLVGYFERPVIVVASRNANYGGLFSSGTILPADYPVAEYEPPVPKTCPACGHTEPLFGTDLTFL
jgi:hypothetical protein